MNVFKSILLGSLALWLTSCGSGDGLKQTHVTIGTGGLTGVYYQVGSRVSELVNKKEALYGLKCTSSSTGGSVANINQLLSGDIDFGMVQSDIQYQACEGKGGLGGKGETGVALRGVLSASGVGDAGGRRFCEHRNPGRSEGKTCEHWQSWLGTTTERDGCSKGGRFGC